LIVPRRYKELQTFISMYESRIEQPTDDILNEEGRNDEYIYFRILNSKFVSQFILYQTVYFLSVCSIFFIFSTYQN